MSCHTVQHLGVLEEVPCRNSDEHTDRGDVHLRPKRAGLAGVCSGGWCMRAEARQAVRGAVREYSR